MFSMMQVMYLIKEYFQHFVKEGGMINNLPIGLMFIYAILAVH